MSLTNCVFFLSNRASYYRSKPVLDLLSRDLEVELQIILTSSLLESEYREVKAEILNNYNNVVYLPLSEYDGTLYGMARSCGRLVERLSNHFNIDRPDIAVCFADRFELLPFALTCAYMQIPLCQIQAGEDSSNIDQKVRHAVSWLADMRFVSHPEAHNKLVHMGLKNNILTGCPSIDVIVDNDIRRPSIPDDHIVCIFHPHTNELYNAKVQLELLLNHVNRFLKDTEYKCYYFMSNNDPGHKDLEHLYKDQPFLKPIYNIPEKEYLRMLATSRCIVGNSSSGLREAGFLGVPALNIGGRQKDRIRGDNVIDCEFNNIYDNLHLVSKMKFESSKLFGDGKAAVRIVKEIKDYGRPKSSTTKT